VVEKRYRTFWRRCFAGWVDGILLTPLTFIDSLISDLTTAPAVRTPWYVFHSLAYFAYPIYMHGRFGQTVGKRLLGVTVTDLSGRALTMSQAFRREMLNMLLSAWWLVTGLLVVVRGGATADPTHVDSASMLALGIGVGILVLEVGSTLVSPKRRAVHDLIAGSVVVRTEMLSGGAQDDADDDEAVAAAMPLGAKQFACPECGAAVNVGASHCSKCERPFEYHDARPVVPRSDA
jgi:uncharacterized RDD family membrane protein YckC